MSFFSEIDFKQKIIPILFEAIKRVDICKLRRVLYYGNVNSKDNSNSFPETHMVGHLKCRWKLNNDLRYDNIRSDVCREKTQETTPLLWAIYVGSIDIIELLFEHNADPNIANKRGLTPLLYAITTKNVQIVEALLKNGANPNTPESIYGGLTPLVLLSYLICESDIDKILQMAQILLEHGVDPNGTTLDGSITPLIGAAGKRCESSLLFANLLLEHGVDPNGINDLKPVVQAIKSNNIGLVKLLLEQYGIGINQTNPYELSLLVVAVRAGFTNMVKLLLEQDGIDVNKTNIFSLSALYIACNSGQFDIVKLLMKHDGIKMNIEKHLYSKPLVAACDNGHLGIVKLLLGQDGIDVNKESHLYNSPLIVACKKGHFEVIKLLLQQVGIYVNRRSMGYGKTPLSYAKEFGHTRVVDLLNSYITTQETMSWVGVQHWMWWSDPQQDAREGRTLCKNRRRMVWTVMHVGERIDVLPSELWMLIMTFVKNEHLNR